MSEPAASCQSDYEAIVEAVSESARGRWFLAEFARRNRAANTAELLDAIERLYKAATESRESGTTRYIRHDLEEMRKSIEETRSDLAAIKPRGDGGPHHEEATDLDAIASAAERATRDILAAAERVQEIGERLRGQGADSDLCDELDTHARGIFMASSFQDMTGQRTTRLATALQHLEERIGAMLAALGGDAASTKAG